MPKGVPKVYVKRSNSWKKLNIPKSDVDLFLELNSQGLAATKIAKKTGYSNYAVWKTLKDCGAPHIDNRINHFDEQYFSEINTRKKAYWLGFIAADGYLNEKYWAMQFGLARKDRNVIEEFCKDINFPEEKIIDGIGKDNYYNGQLIKGGEKSRVSLNSREMAEDLIRLNIRQKKSLTLRPPDLKEEWFWDYLRGYFDGDGWIATERNRIGLCCSDAMAVWFVEEFDKRDFKANIVKETGSKISIVTVSGRSQIFLLEEKLYHGDPFCLERKRNVFKEKREKYYADKKFKKDRIEKMLFLRSSGYSRKQIAQEVGLTENGVKSLFRRHKVNETKNTIIGEQD